MDLEADRDFDLGVLMIGRRLQRPECKPRSNASTIASRLGKLILFMIGRSILIKSVLNFIPVYLLVNMAVPSSYLKGLEYLFQNSLEF